MDFSVQCMSSGEDIDDTIEGKFKILSIREKQGRRQKLN